MLLALVWGAGALLALRGDHGEGLGGEIQLGQIYDLTGAVKQGYRMELLPRSDPELARAIETEGVKAYSLQMQDTLEPILPARIAKGAVMAEWRALLLRRPALYLRDRLALFWQVVALGLGLLILYLSRRRPADIAMAGLILGAFVFAAPFFFVSVACDYRCLYPLDLAVMLALFQFFASPAPH